MDAMQEARRIKLGTKDDKKPWKMPASLGRATDGLVKTVADPNYVYATSIEGFVLTVFNDKVPNRLWLPVWIGTTEDDYINIRVLGIRDVYSTLIPAIPPNISTALSLDGDDPLPVMAEMFMPWQVRWTGVGLNISVTCQALLSNTSSWIAPQTVSFDLTSHVPGTDGYRWVLVSVDNTGTIILTNGSIVSTLTLADIPTVPIHNMALSAVKLWYGQTTLYFSQAQTSFLDLRFNGVGSVWLPSWVEVIANKSTDITMGGITPSDILYPSQKATKTYVDNQGFLTSVTHDATLSGAGTVASPLVVIGGGGSGTYGLNPIDCTSQILVGGETHFTFTPAADAILVMLNGMLQKPADITLDVDKLGFTLSFGVELGDNLIVIRAETVSGAPTAGHIIQDAGVSKTQRSKLNFIGATIADNAGNNSTDVTITSGGTVSPALRVYLATNFR